MIFGNNEGSCHRRKDTKVIFVKPVIFQNERSFTLKMLSVKFLNFRKLLGI